MLSVIRNLKQVPIDVAKFYAAQIVSSLIYIHSRYLIYRDLKPENILIDVKQKFSIKVIDFGTSHHYGSDNVAMSQIYGTPYYIAPEVL